ncbi:NAD(P)-binding Rossmann-fold containing protein [Glarea lozoyensis ATCC 20868]|uniref:NAD(P)-binding Rossmann-fold containing protein n=1 Tax=Glarea lozoyensis (strain ATCC 20868 / MF5171) TaxID=1116229 RepID=S3EDS2_GLAL2|nr:NAD(P)-binding Rossmann-fold containing protein [Glarea lozoyensis ATCC 20868]EPE36433.1 NAD(P)-binding Rossmann-fold containing protein [Glarea lozoyensis ATCC 20868]
MADLDINNIFGVKGIVAVITGGGSGLGLYIAKALDANGAKAVYIIGRRKATLDEAVKQAKNGTIIPIVGDVTSKDSLAAAAAQIEREQGYINILFANSGIIGIQTPSLGLPTDRKATIQELQAAHWKPEIEEFTNPFNVNVSAAFYTTLAFLTLLDAGNAKGNITQKSSVVITSSIAGYTRTQHVGLSYSFSKAAATHMIKTLATLLTPYKIRVNGIAPGMFPSEMTADMKALQGEDPREEGAVEKGVIPMERCGREEEIAGTAVYLASKAGAYLSGCVVVPDGGRMGGISNSY